MRMSPVTPRARNERLSYSPSTMIGALRFFSVRSSRTRCKSSWSCSQSIGSLTERPGDDKGCAQEAIIYRPPDMRIVPGEEEVNFERVTKVYREESGKKTLVALEADFYDKLASYIARLDESANKEAQKDPNSPKALLLQDELRKVRKRRDQIFTYRERKLALLASSRASGASPQTLSAPPPAHVAEARPPSGGINTTYGLKKEAVVTSPKTIPQSPAAGGKPRPATVANPRGKTRGRPSA